MIRCIMHWQKLNSKNGLIDEAIKNYKLSSENSLSNNNQKAISCMKLGYIYFERPDYRLSQAYLDTCIMNLSNEHPKYDEIRTLSPQSDRSGCRNGHR